jgi:hypothetical protein
MRLSPAIPILRIFSEDKAKEFYLDFLGFKLEWEHRFGDNFPLYARIKRSELIIDLSGHYGDAAPGGTLFVPVENIVDLCLELQVKQYRYAKPAVEDVPWGRMMEVWDPFGNRLRFSEAAKSDMTANP